jgi:hypothetical protein
VDPYNYKPVVTAISYLKGASTTKGQIYTFSSSASDKEDGDLSESITWTSSISGTLGKGASIQATLPSGSHVITAKAADKNGNTGTAVKTVSVTWVNATPSVQILDIVPGAAGSEGQVHEFTGTAADDEEGNVSGSIAWSSSLEGSLGTGERLLSTLRPGTHTITARVCDSKGACSAATKTVSVASFNNPPIASIVSAIGGVQDASGQIFEFSGTATDKEDGTLSGGIIWTSSIDGNLGQGSKIKPHLSSGTHTITAKVTDSKGKTDSQSISITSVKAAYIKASVTTQTILGFKLTKLTWTGGVSSVDIYKNGTKIGIGPAEGTQYYWYSKSAIYKVCDPVGLKCSDQNSSTTAKKRLKRVKKSNFFR